MPPLTLTRSTPVWCDFEPPVDLFDDGDAYTVVVEIPGVSPSSINVVQSGTSLIITGLRALHLEPGPQPHVEGDYGRFHRLIELSSAVQPAGRDVSYSRGLLTIHLPKCPLLASA
jgi:HSP20 family protein